MQAVIRLIFWNRSRDCSVYTTSEDGVLRRMPAQMFQSTWFLFCLFGVEGVKRTAKSSLSQDLKNSPYLKIMHARPGVQVNSARQELSWLPVEVEKKFC